MYTRAWKSAAARPTRSLETPRFNNSFATSRIYIHAHTVTSHVHVRSLRVCVYTHTHIKIRPTCATSSLSWQCSIKNKGINPQRPAYTYTSARSHTMPRNEAAAATPARLTSAIGPRSFTLVYRLYYTRIACMLYTYVYPFPFPRTRGPGEISPIYTHAIISLPFFVPICPSARHVRGLIRLSRAGCSTRSVKSDKKLYML